ncbi:MAG: alpha-hydroxy acid oxidase [Nesterenkonia sp.]|nr:alpha-hydroxy acid oxidase [Nesterenkonia sp.]
MTLSRRLPRVSELRPLMQFRPIDPNRRRARLSRAADVHDLRAIARRRTPRPAFDYVDGAAVDELTARRTREAMTSCELLPRMLHGVGEVDTSVHISGQRADLPFGIAPTGFTRFMHAEGEDAGAAAAAAHGIPFTLSTMGTRSVEEVARVSGMGQRWFQLYLWKDREASLGLIERAWANGFDTLLVTVDTPVAGQRLRDVRNGMTIPPRLGVRTLLDASHRPEWWYNLLTTDPLTFASLSDTTQDLPNLINAMFDPTLSLEDLRWIREVWPGRLFVKGVVTVDDAHRSLDVGADGLVVSSHGGRQLDRAPVPLRALPEIRDAVGPDVPLIYDSGLMSGNDVITALALGADFTMIGRAYLYGLMAGGRQGVDRVIDLLAEEVRVSMMLMGASSVADLTRDSVRTPWDSGSSAAVGPRR